MASDFRHFVQPAMNAQNHKEIRAFFDLAPAAPMGRRPAATWCGRERRSAFAAVR
jgi:hypothetical protein